MTHDSGTWILVMDSKQALFYLKDQHGHLVKNHIIIYATSDSECENTRNSLGRSFDSAGNARHFIEPHLDKHTQEQMSFVREVNQYLQEALNEHAYDKLIIVAPPKILGLLRQMLSKNVMGVVAQEINKEFANLTDCQTQEALANIGVVFAH